jgi:hypothetical protein
MGACVGRSFREECFLRCLRLPDFWASAEELFRGPGRLSGEKFTFVGTESSALSSSSEDSGDGDRSGFRGACLCSTSGLTSAFGTGTRFSSVREHIGLVASGLSNTLDRISKQHKQVP